MVKLDHPGLYETAAVEIIQHKVEFKRIGPGLVDSARKVSKHALNSDRSNYS